PATRAVCGAAASGRLDLGDAIADGVYHLDEARAGGIVLELSPDVLDVRVDRALVAVEGDAVHRVEELRPGEDAAGLASHRGQELELGGSQLDRPAGHRRPQPRHVEDELADLDPLGRLDGAFAAPEDGAHPGDELARAEWLRHVVVGAELEAEE